MNSNAARPFGLLCLASLLIGAAPTVPDRAVADATTTIATLHARLGRAYAPMMSRAKAVLIAPTAKEPAILLIHSPTGWSEPAFFTANPLNTSDPAILLVMSDRALDAILRQRGLTLDGPTALTVGRLSANAKAGGELLIWPKGKARLDDSGPTQDDAANTAYYGHPRNAAEIVGGTPPALRTSKLRNAL